MSALSNKSVKLAVRKHLSTDLRDPRVVHRLKRAAEQRKAEPAIELAPIESEPEDEYGDPRQDYADSLGMSLHEKL